MACPRIHGFILTMTTGAEITCMAMTEELQGGMAMPLWQRLLITLAVMVLTSYLVGVLWQWVFNADIPSYLSGAVGGITAVPTWELLQRIRPKH
jgi:hypothetical protein